MKFGGKDLHLKGQTTEEILSAIIHDEKHGQIFTAYIMNALFQGVNQGRIRFTPDGKSLRWYEEK